MSMLEWKGRPVPWVARWSNEADRTPISVGRRRSDSAVQAFYDDGREVRDDSGILWCREGVNRAGEPQFGEVSIYRQRACMRHRLCQVCGEKITTPVIRWLLHPTQIVEKDGVTITQSPPTCDNCMDLSKVECPVMRRERVVARVLEYAPWGVWGTVVRIGQDGQAQTTGRRYIEGGRTDFPFDYGAVVAKQQVVKWTKWVME